MLILILFSLVHLLECFIDRTITDNIKHHIIVYRSFYKKLKSPYGSNKRCCCYILPSAGVAYRKRHHTVATTHIFPKEYCQFSLCISSLAPKADFVSALLLLLLFCLPPVAKGFRIVFWLKDINREHMGTAHTALAIQPCNINAQQQRQQQQQQQHRNRLIPLKASVYTGIICRLS